MKALIVAAIKYNYVCRDNLAQVDESGTPIDAPLQATVQITRVEIRPNVYMVYWSEPFNNNTNVTHVQDGSTRFPVVPPIFRH